MFIYVYNINNIYTYKKFQKLATKFTRNLNFFDRILKSLQNFKFWRKNTIIRNIYIN